MSNSNQNDTNNTTVNPFDHSTEINNSDSIDEKRPIGQYSESVRLLIADMQIKDTQESKTERASRLLRLLREIESKRTKRELKLLALDLNPDALRDMYKPMFDIPSDVKYNESYKLWSNNTKVNISISSENKSTGLNLIFSLKECPTFESMISKVRTMYPNCVDVITWKIYENGNILRAQGKFVFDKPSIQDIHNNSQESGQPTAAPGQTTLEQSTGWQAPTSTVGVSGAVRKPVTVQQVSITHMPMSKPVSAQIRRTPVSKAYETKDPASVVLANKREESIILSVSDQYFHDSLRLLDEYSEMIFSEGFYPFPANPVCEFQSIDGVLVRVLILTSATVTINNKRYFLHFEVDGEMIKTNHPMILKNQKDVPCEIYADQCNIPEGEKRCIRAIRYRDGSIIRYWLHEIGAKDITEGAAYYKVRDSNIIQINFEQYVKEMHKMGKKLNLG